MRLTCPNCGAEYEVSGGMVPSAGRHVQCTACHTRWFVRGVPGAGLTEDQILRRLETWSPGPRPLPAVSAAIPAAAPARVAAAAPPEAASEAASEPADPPVVVHLPPRPAAPAKPADRPAVARPAPVSAPRLELGEPAAPPAVAAPPSRSRFAHGLLLALVVAAAALAAYLYRGPIADQVPQARPALTAYGDAVDRLRAAIEERLGRFRRDEAPATRG